MKRATRSAGVVVAVVLAAAAAAAAAAAGVVVVAVVVVARGYKRTVRECSQGIRAYQRAGAL